MSRRPIEIGDRVIFTKSKHSRAPGPRARDVMPETGGDGYSYLVEKLWVVEDRTADGRLILRTRRGKRHEVPEDDERLRRASLWERFRFRGRFPGDDDETQPG